MSSVPKAKLESISPATSREYLKHNVCNRIIREPAVDEYASEMRAGRWGISPDVIAFDEDGNIINGQHRLLAIIQSGCTIEAMVGRGYPVNVNGNKGILTADITDAGRKRTVGDQLHRMHGVSDANITAAAARAIGIICIGNGKTLPFPFGKAQGVLAIYGKEIEQTITAIRSIRALKKASVIGTLAFASKAFSEPVLKFAEKLAAGDGLKKGDAALTLRNHLMSHGVPNGGTAISIVAEWVGNALFASLNDKPLLQIKRGANGIEFLRSKQKANVGKVRAIMGVE